MTSTIITQDQVYCELLKPQDLQQAIDVINSVDSWYGVDVTTGIRQFHISLIQNVLSGNIKNQKIVVAKSKNKVVSVAAMSYWPGLPHWNLAFAYSSVNVLKLTSIESLNIKMFEKCIQIAEKDSRFTFYMITRHSKIWDRIELIILENFDYTVHRLEIIEPNQRSKYNIVRNMQGIMAEKHQKDIIVLQATKIFKNKILFSKEDGSVKVIDYDRL